MEGKKSLHLILVKHRRTIYVSGIILLLVCAFINFLHIYVVNKPLTPVENKIVLQPTVPVIPVTPMTIDASDKMSVDEYNKVKNLLTDEVEANDTKSAIEKLSSLIDIDPKIERHCHGFVHEIGHTTYKKYGLVKALSYQDDLCGSGFIHGVIEEYFIDVKDPVIAMQSVCETASFANDSAKCYHGIGHGLMFYTKNDLPTSLKDCDLFKTNFQRILCSEGVFMENFNSDERFHTSQYLHKTDPFFPCPDQTTFYKDSCYFYAPDYYLQLHQDDFKGAIQWCREAEPGFVNKCMMGVGSRTMKRNMGSPKFVEDVCMTAESKDKIASCIDGMVSYFLVQYDSISRANKICELMDDDNQQSCFQSVKNRKYMFMN